MMDLAGQETGDFGRVKRPGVLELYFRVDFSQRFQFSWDIFFGMASAAGHHRGKDDDMVNVMFHSSGHRVGQARIAKFVEAKQGFKTGFGC